LVSVIFHLSAFPDKRIFTPPKQGFSNDGYKSGAPGNGRRENILIVPMNRKAPQKQVLRGYSTPERKKRLLLGGGFAGAFFEAFLAENAATLFGSFFKLLSHRGRACNRRRRCRQLLLLKTGFHQPAS